MSQFKIVIVDKQKDRREFRDDGASAEFWISILVRVFA